MPGQPPTTSKVNDPNPRNGLTAGVCVIHLTIRNTFRLTSRKYWDELERDIKPVHTAVNATAARAAFDELTDKWATRYPAVVKSWDNAWPEFIPFLDYDVEIRKVICSTSPIESLNARYRRAVKARGHFLNEQAALTCLYLVTRSVDPTGTGRPRWAMRWEPALNACAITFSDRFPAAETY
jgi:putative transposase